MYYAMIVRKRIGTYNNILYNQAENKYIFAKNATLQEQVHYKK